jgi:hypothetical protein
MRWIRLDTLRFWFVESWGQPLVNTNSGARDEEGLSVPFKMLAEVRAKVQHDSEVKCCVHLLWFHHATTVLLQPPFLTAWNRLFVRLELPYLVMRLICTCRRGSDGSGCS